MNPLDVPEVFWVMEGTEQEVADSLGATQRKAPRSMLRKPQYDEWELESTGNVDTLIAPEGVVRLHEMRLVWRKPRQVGPE